LHEEGQNETVALNSEPCEIRRREAVNCVQSSAKKCHVISRPSRNDILTSDSSGYFVGSLRLQDVSHLWREAIEVLRTKHKFQKYQRHLLLFARIQL